MKRLIIVALLLIGITLNAQPPNTDIQRPNFTPEQITELRTKKMTLLLELNDDQQKKVFQLQKENALRRQEKRKEMQTFRENNQKPNSDELFKMKNAQLDHQIVYQAEMKKILNEKQFQSWRKARIVKAHKLNKRKTIQKRIKAKAKRNIQNRKMRR